MKFFERIPLRSKLLVIAIVPLAALLFFAAQIIAFEDEKLQIFTLIKEKISGITHVAELASELQEERAKSFQYLIHNGGSGINQLRIQRIKTDEAIKYLKLNFDQDFRLLSQSASLNLLPERRRLVDSLLIGYDECLEFYAQSMLKLYEWIPRIDGQVNHPELVNQLKSQVYLGQAASYLALIRSKYYNGLKLGILDRNEFGKLRNYYASYNASVQQYRASIERERLAELTDRFRNDTLSSTLKSIEESIKVGKINNNISKEKWLANASAAVEILNRLQEEDLLILNNTVDKFFLEKQFDKHLAISLISIVFLLSFLLVFFNISALTRVIGRIEEGILKLSKGDTNIELRVVSKDALGNLSQSINKVAVAHKEVADAAIAIGNGDFSVNIEPKSKQDVLAKAINQMRDNLRKYTEEKNNDLWLNEGLIGISARIRGEKNIHRLTTEALNFLAEFLFAEVGVFYVMGENKELSVTAGYACDPCEIGEQKLKLGNGLPGQVAFSGKPMVIHQVPEGYLNIKSATGKSTPRSIIIFPLIHEDKVFGVLELASFRKFSDKDLLLLNKVGKPISIALNTAFSRLKLEELLEETQAQAEELQAQQEELQVINHELEQQAQRVLQSEEELRAQQEEILQTNNLLEEKANELEQKNGEILRKNENLISFSKEIEKKNEELKTASKYKSEFLANMSHELRTPLNSILLLSKLMGDQQETAPSKEFKEYARIIHNSGKGLLGLINEILDLSKIEAGKMEIETGQASVIGLVEDIKAMFAQLAQQKGLSFEIEYGNNIPDHIQTDKNRVGQVLKNLVSNAIKFTDGGSVKLLVRKAVETPTGENPIERLEFVVIDTGIGIPREKQDIVFEAFQQIDGSANRKFSGTGLGLSISREIAKHLGGSISMQSEIGKGSTFVFSLPLSESKTTLVDEDIPVNSGTVLKKGKYTVDAIPEAVADDRKEIFAGDKCILIIEDDVAFAKELLSVSRKKGYKALVATKGDEGIQLAEQFVPTGIILDLMLPVMDGFSVLDYLKENPATRHIPVHVISALDKNKVILSKGAIDFTKKPLDKKNLEDMFAKIEMALHPGLRKVLVINPDESHAKALSNYLQNLKIDSLLAEDIEQGESLLNNEIGCVVMDLKNTGKPYSHVFENIKSRQSFQNIPLVLYTGKGISTEEVNEIGMKSKNLVYKTADSFNVLLDEVSLFLHLVRDDKKAPASIKPYLQGEALKGKKVLIADDDVRNVFSLTKVLEMHQLKVITASDGIEALMVLEENPDTEIVLMDMMMPEKDGYETINTIRKNDRYKSLPIIAVTAKAMKGDKEKCIQAGASDYISKPIDSDQLVSLMKVWLYK